MGEHVREILEAEFAGMQADLEEVPGQRINGSLVWEGFMGHDHVERQQMVRQALQVALGPEMQSVGVLLTYTPVELGAMMAA